MNLILRRALYELLIMLFSDRIHDIFSACMQSDTFSYILLIMLSSL